MSALNSYSGATLTALYDRYEDAQEARSRLLQLGIATSDIRLTPEQDTSVQSTTTTHDHKGFFESLADLFMPAEDRYTYAEGLSRGSYLLTVTNVPDALYDSALDILDDEGAVDLDQREQSWRSEGWSGYNASAYGDASATTGSYSGTGASSGIASGSSYNSGINTASSGLNTGATLGNEDVIPVVEEELQIGKRDVNHGRVRVRSYVREIPVSQQVNLREERVQVERRPVDRAVTGTEAVFQDRVLEAEEHVEEAVVAKQARVVEEVALRRDVTSHEETVSDTVRRTEVEVDDERGVAGTGIGTGTKGRGPGVL